MVFHTGKLRPDLKLWYESQSTPDRFFTTPADDVNALTPVNGEGILSSLLEAAERLRCPQEGAEGPGHQQVLPDGDGVMYTDGVYMHSIVQCPVSPVNNYTTPLTLLQQSFTRWTKK